MKANTVNLLDMNAMMKEAPVVTKGNSSTSFSSVMTNTESNKQNSNQTKKESLSGMTPIQYNAKVNTTSVEKTAVSNTKADVKKKSEMNTTSQKNSEVKDVYGEELASKVKEVLGLTDKEFEELMAEMGICLADLFNPEILQQLVLSSFGAGQVSDALLNEQLANALLETGKALEEVIASLEQEIIELPTNEMAGESFDKVLSSTVENTEKEQNVETKDSSDDDTISDGIEVEVNKESSTGSNKDALNKGQDGNDNTQTFVEFFANKVDVSGMDNNMTIPEFKEIVTDLVNKIKLNINPAKTSVELILNPESLGKVQVVVANKDGVLTAQLNVQNNIAKEALESSIQTLKESFEGQGLKVEKVEVTIGNYTSEYAEHEGSGQQQADQGAKKKINVEDYMESELDSTTEEQMETVSSLNGTVEYTA